jgi:hypothetical protein
VGFHRFVSVSLVLISLHNKLNHFNNKKYTLASCLRARLLFETYLKVYDPRNPLGLSETDSNSNHSSLLLPVSNSSSYSSSSSSPTPLLPVPPETIRATTVSNTLAVDGNKSKLGRPATGSVPKKKEKEAVKSGKSWFGGRKKASL